MLLVLGAAGLLHVSAAWAQSDIAFGPLEDTGTVIPASRFEAGPRRLSLASWVHDPVGTAVIWIMGTAEKIRPHVIPENVVLHVIPGHSSYRYAVVGGQRFVVDATTRAVVYVVD
jgi:hypothetical protein